MSSSRKGIRRAGFANLKGVFTKFGGLKYNRNDKVTDFHLAYLLNEGRAKNLDSNIYKKREPHVDKLEYEFNKTGDIDFYSGELYLNAIGDVVSGCDWSYKSQKKYRLQRCTKGT